MDKSPNPFETPSFTGLVDASWCHGVSEEWLSLLLDPGQAVQTIHWGRNYLFVADWKTRARAGQVVVKQFRHETLKARLRRRLSGSKAAKSFRIAREIQRLGLLTPDPLLLAESRRPARPSYYVSRRLEDKLELRYYLRALNAGTEKDEFPEIQRAELLVLIAVTARRMHDGGVWHRDFSAGNLLLGRSETGQPDEIYLVDLNRARSGLRLGRLRRLRDLARLTIIHREHQRELLEAYWGATPSPWITLAYRFYFRSFHGRHAVKNKLRAGLSALTRPFRGRSAYPHIPPAPDAASSRDKVVWDPLSDQPHQHASRWEKLKARSADLPDHLRELAAVTAALPRIARRYRRLRSELYQRPVVLGGMGVGVRPWPDAPDRLLEALEDLGVGKVLLRLHPWQDHHEDEEELARELSSKGYELSFALPQNRDLVRDQPRWRAAVEELTEKFVPFGKGFQVGHAINRSKWGIWRLGEYLDLGATAAEIVRRHEGAEVVGPAVIDFEFHRLAAALNLARSPLNFDVVSSLLYVDRRGDPERRQLGLDTVDKVVLLRAIAETSRSGSERCWITEVNWPLREGPHAPAGRSVAVSEDKQADYLARYYLLALSTGLVERCFWWQLVAKGYGLADPSSSTSLRRRPAFLALATLHRLLDGATLEEPPVRPSGAYLLSFARPLGERIVVGWSPDSEVEAELPAEPVERIGQDGLSMPLPGGPRVLLGSSVQYFLLPS